MAKSHDLEHIPDEELQAELSRRASQARCKEVMKRERIGQVLAQACNDYPRFQEAADP